MTARTFGRKGGVELAPPSRPVFGNAAPDAEPADPEMQRRVEAFLASERARKDNRSGNGVRGTAAANLAPVPGEKSLVAAYVIWFFFGAISGHRFYLGFPVSGVIQASLWFVSWMLIMGGFFGAVLSLGIAGMWTLTDAFLIPGLHRQAIQRQRELRSSYVFE